MTHADFIAELKKQHAAALEKHFKYSAELRQAKPRTAKYRDLMLACEATNYEVYTLARVMRLAAQVAAE